MSEEHDLVFTSNRGKTRSDLRARSRGRPDQGGGGSEAERPGLRPGRGRLLAANVGEPSIPGSFTVSVVDVNARAMLADIPVAGRTRWTVFDAETGCFYVNIAGPAQIAIVESDSLSTMAICAGLAMLT